MGNPLTKQKETESEALANLTEMRVMMKQQEQIFQLMLSSSENQRRVQPNIELRFRSYMSINASSTPGRAFNDAITSLFGEDLQGTVGAVANGLLDMFLGNAVAGENVSTSSELVFVNSVPLRVDYMFYQFAVTSEGAVSRSKSCFAAFTAVNTLKGEHMDRSTWVYMIHSAMLGARNIRSTFALLKDDLKLLKSITDKSTHEEVNKILGGLSSWASDIYESSIKRVVKDVDEKLSDIALIFEDDPKDPKLEEKLAAVERAVEIIEMEANLGDSLAEESELFARIVSSTKAKFESVGDLNSMVFSKL